MDLEVDVLVVGGGGGGMVAAIAAAEQGAKVAIAEKTAQPGGNTALSTGSIPGAGTRFQRAAGIDDSPQRGRRSVTSTRNTGGASSRSTGSRDRPSRTLSTEVGSWAAEGVGGAGWLGGWAAVGVTRATAMPSRTATPTATRRMPLLDDRSENLSVGDGARRGQRPGHGAAKAAPSSCC